MKSNECKVYFNRAMERARDNALLPAFLLGMAKAWKATGDIDEGTYNDMRRAARGLYEERKTAQ